MNLTELKKSATAAELCLIDKVMELNISESVRAAMNRYHDILSPRIMNALDDAGSRDRVLAERIRREFTKANEEFKTSEQTAKI